MLNTFKDGSITLLSNSNEERIIRQAMLNEVASEYGYVDNMALSYHLGKVVTTFKFKPTGLKD